MLKIKALTILVLLAMLASGCSVFGLGESKFSCPGKPNGVQCKSSREIYEATNNGAIPQPTDPKELKKSKKKSSKTPSKKQSNEPIDANKARLNNYLSPATPNKPVPIRTPAEVMRIWVAPWEDANGDLIVSGYIFTEIEPRRWLLGEGESEQQYFFNPLK